MINADFVFDGRDQPAFSSKVDEDKLYQQFYGNLPVSFRGYEFLVLEIVHRHEADDNRLLVTVREIV